MVVEETMDSSQEAKDYLRQFSTPKAQAAVVPDSNLESMFDTWTREKNKLRNSHKSGLSKEWNKIPSALSPELLGYDPNFSEDLFENETLDDFQDTYMNEEAFLEQLLQQDTKPTKRESKRHESKFLRSLNKENKRRKHSGSKKHEDLVSHKGHLNDSKNFVAGHMLSNESKKAVLRKGVCQDSISPTYSPIKQQQQVQQTSRIKLPLTEVLTQPLEIIPPPDGAVFDPYSPQPKCQKCGWAMTTSIRSVHEVPVLSPAHQAKVHQPISPHFSTSVHSPHHTTRHQHFPHSPSPLMSHPHSPKSMAQALDERSPRHRKTSEETHPPSHQSNVHTKERKTSNNMSPQSTLNNISKSLTTSKHCHSRASQTDPNLLNQDPSPVAEVETKETQKSQRIFTKAKPPSGRIIKNEGSGMIPGDNFVDQIPVVEAAKSGNVEILQNLLTTDPEHAKYHDVQGNNLLHLAAEKGHLPCVQLLSNMFPDFCELENKAKFTPAALAVKAGHVEVLDWLLEKTCAREEILPAQSKKSLLHHAAKFGQDGCLRNVLEKMTAIDRNNNCCDSNGNSPAHVAAKHGHLLCLQSLVEFGVDVTKANRYGHSPCYYADFSNHKLCASYLMVVETCLTLAKKLIRLEKSMEQLSNSLAKYSDNADMTFTYDYNADRSSATSSVEDDGTRDEAWQLLCRKFEEASKRLVVFRTQNRAVRPLRPTKLALLALAQSKEETQAALSSASKVKITSSTNDLVSDAADSNVNLHAAGRSKSVPDLHTSSSKEQSHQTKLLNIGDPRDISGHKKGATFAVTGIPSLGDKHKLCGDKSASVDNAAYVIEVQSMGLETPAYSSNPPIRNSNIAEHKRSSSVSDILNSEEKSVINDDIVYHLKTRVVPPLPKLSQGSLTPPPLPPKAPVISKPFLSHPPPPPPPPQHPAKSEHLPPPLPTSPPPPAPSGLALGETEPTSDFFEELNYKRESESDLDNETLQKILEMQEEIMQCDPNIAQYNNSRIRTPVKLELTPDEFKETYARSPPKDSPFPFPQFQFRRGPPVRKRYTDTMNKSGNNSHSNEPHENLITEAQEQETIGKTSDTIEKPWYEISDEDEGKAEEFFTLL